MVYQDVDNIVTMLLLAISLLIIFMMAEQEGRLNFYSKYNRVRGRQDIDTLYTFIDNNNPPEIRILNVSLMRSEKEKKMEAEIKLNTSRQTDHKDLVDKENNLNRSAQLDEVNDRVQKLQRLERQFHQQMARRERFVKKKRQLKQQKRRQQQKSKDQPINVVDFQPSNTSSLKSSGVKGSKNQSMKQQVNLDDVQLDFQEYYHEIPELPLQGSFSNNAQTKKAIRQIIQKQKRNSKFVESVDEEGDHKADSIVIGRMQVRKMSNGKVQEQRQETKKCNQVQLTHSQSENAFLTIRFDQKQSQEKQKKVQEKINTHQQKQSVVEILQDYSPRVRLEQIDENTHLLSTDQPKQDIFAYYLQNSSQNDQKVNEINIRDNKTSKDINFQIGLYQHLNNEHDFDSANILIANKTGTEEGDSIKQEIQDKVDPILNKSSYRHQNYHAAAQPSVFYSQTLPNSRINAPREVQSILADSLYFHPLQSPNDASATQMRLQNKKSSFKRLMAENRSNLVPRMAISTILNEHINQVLIDFKAMAQTSRSPLQQSIISSQNPSPTSRKKKINFKQKILQQQIEKPYNKEGRPVFERAKAKIQKNRSFLVGFFAEN